MGHQSSLLERGDRIARRLSCPAAGRLVAAVMATPSVAITSEPISKPVEPKLKQIIEVNLPVRPVLLISIFHYRQRVLDAWVCRHLVDAKENFARKQTVAQRKVYVTMPVLINEQMREASPPPQLNRSSIRRRSRY